MEQFFDFIQKSPTCFHAVEQIARMLDAAGGIRLEETEVWSQKVKATGGMYYVVRNDSSIIAFQLPKKDQQEQKEWSGYHIFAAHSDSPCFKIKENPELKTEEVYGLLNVEKYGGMILSTWLDRPLSIAGRVIVEADDKLVTRLVNLEDVTLVIPNVAIHLNRDMNKGVEYNVQTDLRPLYSLQKDTVKINEVLASHLEINPKEIWGKDLYLYAKEACSMIGVDQQMIAGPRLDDLACAYAGAVAFCDASQKIESTCINVLAVFDNEEIGSGTKQGADSTFLTDVLTRIEEVLDVSCDTRMQMRARSFMISADNAHALHPNHPEKSDPTNKPVLNGGIVLKYHGGQKYTTDAYSEAVLRKLCRKADVACQTYANRSDIVGGSTLGNIVTAHLSVPAVDIGLPQLAMHSAYETAGAKDLEDMVLVAKHFFLE